ncbi:MAG: SHOCT domain-containing protein [Nitrospiraceae bacterium]|nr:SHOCT domain-containing protein [Nitrospiraceae bacterium]
MMMDVFLSSLYPVLDQFRWRDWGASPDTMGWGMGWAGLIFMLVFWIVVIAGVVLLVKWTASYGQRRRGGESALEILKKRYARGEIDKKEFEEKRKDILGQ